MKQVHNLLEQYKDDAYNYDDYDDNKINKVINKLGESLQSLNEHNAISHTQAINEFKDSLQDDEDKDIVTDFITYCKYHK